MNRQRDIIEHNESTEEPDQKPIPRILMIFDDIMGGVKAIYGKVKKLIQCRKSSIWDVICTFQRL